jgi:6-phosphogluconolactonase/glucosamine-6-phosphate isomerase/deaminase
MQIHSRNYSVRNFSTIFEDFLDCYHETDGICADAIATRGVFVLALSGGSLPSFLASLQASFDHAGCDPQFDKWYVILADERCMSTTHVDSNLGSLQEKLFSAIGIPAKQIYSINPAKVLNESTLAVAQDYELVVRGGSSIDPVACSIWPSWGLDLMDTRVVSFRAMLC